MSIEDMELDQLSLNTIRTLAIDAVSNFYKAGLEELKKKAEQ